VKTSDRVRFVERPGLAWLEAMDFSTTGLVDHAFSTRRGTVDDLRAAVGLAERPLITVRQVHGDRLVVVRGPEEAAEVAGTEGDGLLTRDPGVVVAVWTADCLPVLMLDPVRLVVAAIHSGWRGTALRIAGKAVRRMAEEFGTDPADVLAAVGPGAGPCCYEVDEPVLARLAEVYPGAAASFASPRGEGRALLDLGAAVRWDLKETGVPAENVTVVDQCTVCQPEWFFSYRREGRNAGRLAALIGLREGTGCRKLGR
jgi:hypothetical protein